MRVTTDIKKNVFWSKNLTKSARVYQKVSDYLTESFPYLPSDGKYNLTISHEQKFIWFRVAKVGTNSILDVFSRAEVPLNLDHSWSSHYPLRKYRDYFKFAFVRNPWDRLISCWLNKVVDNNYFMFSDSEHRQMQKFNNFVDYVEDIDVRSSDIHLRLQSKLIDLNNIDYLGHFERFEFDLEVILKVLGLGSVEIKKNNYSLNRKDYRSYYTEKTSQKVADIYLNDINIFSYQFDGDVS